MTARRSHSTAILFSNVFERVATFLGNTETKNISKEDVAYMIRNAMSDHAIQVNREQ